MGFNSEGEEEDGKGEGRGGARWEWVKRRGRREALFPKLSASDKVARDPTQI